MQEHYGNMRRIKSENRIRHRQHFDSWCIGAVIRHAISRQGIAMVVRRMVSLKYIGLRPANERRRYKVTPSLIGWALPRISPASYGL